MSRTRSTILTLAVAGVVLILGRAAAEPERDADKAKTEVKAKSNGKAEGKSASAKPPAAKAEKGTFKVEATFKGVFEAANAHEIILRPKAWAGLPVAEVIEAGSEVKKGDVLLKLDSEKIDKAIRDMETEIAAGELAMQQAEREFPLMKTAAKMDLDNSRRNAQMAQENFEKFKREDKSFVFEMAHYRKKSAQEYLENEEEELKQLEKMYRRKDLTEETEEIILKRQRSAVDQAKFFARSTERSIDSMLKLMLPRQEKEMEDAAERAALSLKRAEATWELALRQKEMALEKARADRAKAREKLAEVKADRELFTVKSPADGLVYYGKCVNGYWATAPLVAPRLNRGGSVQSDEVVMTVVSPDKLFLRGGVEEKDSRSFAKGATCKVVPNAMPDVKLDGTVTKLSAVPVANDRMAALGGGGSGPYEVRVEVKDAPKSLVPGMTANVKVETYRKDDAVTVPSSAVFSDDADEDKHYVYKLDADNKPEKRWVTVGKKANGKSEIVSGLSAGDEITLTKPQ